MELLWESSVSLCSSPPYVKYILQLPCLWGYRSIKIDSWLRWYQTGIIITNMEYYSALTSFVFTSLAFKCLFFLYCCAVNFELYDSSGITHQFNFLSPPESQWDMTIVNEKSTGKQAENDRNIFFFLGQNTFPCL